MMDIDVHESSYVDDGAEVGAGTRIWHFSHVMRGAVIGEGCVLGQNVFVAAGARLGRRCRVQNNVSVYDGVVLEDDVFCGPGAVFTNVRNPRATVSRKGQFRATLVGRGATIGANATVVCGVAIGDWAFIAAGAVVTRDVPPHALVAGNPARRIGWACRCGGTLKAVAGPSACGECGEVYDVDADGVRRRSGA
jgi:UDP-2-acetamido-3-amino-2,3-dideoxy-glucuronate N-acetyltransferase